MFIYDAKKGECKWLSFSSDDAMLLFVICGVPTFSSGSSSRVVLNPSSFHLVFCVFIARFLYTHNNNTLLLLVQLCNNNNTYKRVSVVSR